ncbi:MAG: TetR family transcriptional regulator [Bryobacteraceae bacterium]|nr:TetR family transcriptional regulator [Bryobacteraceae bacterium]
MKRTIENEVGSNHSLTRQRILDAAETLFAEKGFEATSLRMITAEAGVNLAAVNYHFRSKDALIDAVIARRIQPINQERLAMLAEATDKAAGRPPELEDIVRAMIAPVLRLRQRDPGVGRRVGLLFGRTYADPNEMVRPAFFNHMREIFRPFTEALRRALPSLPPAELLWRMHFGVGVMAHTLAGCDHLQVISGGLCDLSDVEGVIERMVNFICAGMRAPLVAQPGRYLENL